MNAHRIRHQYALLAAIAVSHAGFADDYVFVDSFESSDCSQPLSCTTVVGTCVSGQVTDAASASPLRARFNIGLGCEGGAIGGPCGLYIAAYDALDFATNPPGSTPLGAGETTLDACGRYRFASVSAPSSGFVAIVTDDAPGGTAYLPAEATHALSANQHLDGMTALAARIDDVSMWGLADGQDYVNSGVLLLMFSTGGTPTAGVSVTGAGTARYFSDTDAQRYTASSTATSTGVNGSALYVGAGGYSTLGGETGGCAWNPAVNNWGTIAGVVTFLEYACQ